MLSEEQLETVSVYVLSRDEVVVRRPVRAFRYATKESAQWQRKQQLTYNVCLKERTRPAVNQTGEDL